MCLPSSEPLFSQIKYLNVGFGNLSPLKYRTKQRLFGEGRREGGGGGIRRQKYDPNSLCTLSQLET